MTITLRPQKAFYVAGGNLMPDAQSYVVRPADDELFDSICEGHYSYVLTSRQMGKSSLMHRTSVRLMESGITSVMLDLTGIGANLSAEQWYFGLLAEIGKQLGLADQMERYWTENARHGPLYRFTHALSDVALAHGETSLAIFIDEIDFVRGLKNFSTDEFFAAIRQCYNRRASDPEMRRLTFCLLGVATPADLIRDVHTTPFNIGRQIDLTDFTLEECLPLVGGLDSNPEMAYRKLQRIFDWTNGHPYLTQKLCLAVSERKSCSLHEIDLICREMFLASGKRRSEDNLIFVHNTLRQSPENLASVIGMYRRVLNGSHVISDPADPVVAVLRLAGVVRAEAGRLRIRNHIYELVFDKDWVKENMPDADAQRERAAYRKGAIRAVVASAIVLAIVLTVLYNINQANQRLKTTQNDLNDTLVRSKYQQSISDLTLAGQSLAENDVPHATQLLNECFDLSQGQASTRFEWRYLWGLCHREAQIMTVTGKVLGVVIHPNNETVSVFCDDGTLSSWDALTGHPIHSYKLEIGQAFPKTAVFTSDGARVIVADLVGVISVVDVHSGKILRQLPPLSAPLRLALSSNDKTLIVGTSDGNVSSWDMHTDHLSTVFQRSTEMVKSVAISPDGTQIAGGYVNGMLVWTTSSGEISNCPLPSSVATLQFSPDKKSLVAGGKDGKIRVISLASKQISRTLRGSEGVINDIGFSQRGAQIVAASSDTAIHFWNPVSNGTASQLSGHSGSVNCLKFASNGKFIVTGGCDQTVRVWKQPLERPVQKIAGLPQHTFMMHFLQNNRLALVEDSEDTLSLWNIERGALIWKMPGKHNQLSLVSMSPDETQIYIKRTSGLVEIRTLIDGALSSSFQTPGALGFASAISPDGRILATARLNKSIDLLDLANRQSINSLTGSINQIRSVTFSGDGKWLSVVGNTSFIEIWSLSGHPKLSRIPMSGPTSGAAAFSPDSRLLAISTNDGIISIFNTQTWKLETQIHIPGPENLNILFTPDSQAIATGSKDGRIRLWDIASGIETISLQRGIGCINNIQFSNGGAMLAAATPDGNIHRWFAPSISRTEPTVSIREARVSALPTSDQSAILQSRSSYGGN